MLWRASRRLAAFSGRRGLMVDGADLTDWCIEPTGLDAWNAWCDRRPRRHECQKNPIVIGSPA